MLLCLFNILFGPIALRNVSEAPNPAKNLIAKPLWLRIAFQNPTIAQ